VLATVEDSPGDAAGVLALEEEGLGLSILEAEDLAVATDVQLTLQFPNKKVSTNYPDIYIYIFSIFVDDFCMGYRDWLRGQRGAVGEDSIIGISEVSRK
jgi:hypothetical protein